MSQPLRVLVVEDSEDDFHLLLRELRRGGYEPAALRVQDAPAMRRALDEHVWDVVISDYTLPGFFADDALRILQEHNQDLPFLIVSGSISQEQAVATMKAGAHDFITKGAMARLVPAIERELRESRVREERRQSEIDRQESEARYRSIFENNHSVMLLIDAETGEIVEGNAAACEFYGYTAEEMRRLPIAAINQASSAELRACLDAAVSGHQRHFFFLHRLKKGEIRDVESFAGPIQVQGRVLVFSIVHDITLRKRAEKQLRKLSRAVEQSTSMVIITDLEGRIEYVNPQFSVVTGYGVDDVMGRNPRILKSGETPPEAYRRLWETVLAGREWHGEFRNRRKDGSLYWEYASIAPVTDESGVITHFVAVKEDITELKDAEAALRVSEARYRCLVEASPNAIALIDLNRRLQMVNRCGTDLLGFDHEQQVLGRDILEFFSPEEQGRGHEAFQEMLARGHLENLHLSLRTRNDGSRPVVEISGTIIRDSQGRPESILVVGADISERKRAEEALRKANQELEVMNRQLAEASERSQRLARAALVANQTKSQFLANVSHEIRTPMSGILVTINLLQETLLSTEQREYIQTLDHSARILLSIINDILDFSKLEAGKLELETVDFDLEETLRTLMKVLTIQANAKGLALTCHLEGAWLGILRGDPVRLRQVFINLINNAIKFTEKGEVAVQVRIADRPMVTEILERANFAGRPPGETEFARRWERGEDEPGGVWLYAVVKDTGIGIPPGKLGNIFEAFTQADSSTTRKYGGTGLGLTIAARLVSLMQGKIWVESTVGQGTAFHFLVQLARAAQNAVPVRIFSEIAEMPMAPLRVLLVEDNRINQRTLRRVLEKRGHAVVVAGNGEAALRLLTTQTFDVILMDVHMPVMDGFATTSAIRTREWGTNRHVPIVAMTANAMKGDQQRCLASGMDEYISKPVQIKELLGAIYRVTSRKPGAEIALAQELANRMVFNSKEALAQVEGDEDELRFLVGMFLEEEPALMAEIRSALKRGDRVSLVRAVHNLKGMLGSLGGQLAADAADHLEDIGEKGSPADLESALAGLETELNRFCPILKDLEAGRPLGS
ncbi:MAG TPA: PAS domain S-box protein [Candidatus Paceibacterota bacterium]|nr:PAS domain S-box protein [Verrucomicrobiota bacterium]HRY51084.1 PAS domain S-box protein [Candidatus Paceibacterota bacterium]